MASKKQNSLKAEAILRLQKKGFSLPAPNTQSERLLHELQVHQIELELQQQELIAARDLAESSSASYQALYDFAPVGYAVLTVKVRLLKLI
ncbi:hypothetical protein [Shewanella aestuarii]|uniref:Uncharacterized protein n=1 Tax=Shewanella aestuarii TaxID=1028752 RepID=A0A6G9QNN1_9GAMM|nr:hypothetical protein [Shewanella aestuarii]QIR15693.1 hypothetical protein HBH39_15360 [Shewanella aestuarii]